MSKKVKCWDIFTCNDEKCPVYELKELRCWLISGTHCRQEIQGKFLEKMEMCLSCEIFEANMDVDAMRDTLNIVDKQFKEFRSAIIARDEELESTSMELALGLSEAFEALNKVATGDPRARISEASANELIGKLKQTVNKTAEGIEAVVNQSHEFAIGLAEHFDVLNRVSKGELTARISESSEDELLKALGRVTNQMIESVSREISERKQAEIALRESKEELQTIYDGMVDGVLIALTETKKFIHANSGICNMLGYSETEFLSMTVNDIHPQDKLAYVIDKFTAMAEGRISHAEDLPCLRKDGSILFVDLSTRLITYKGHLCLVGFFHDLTERKKAEEVLREKEEREALILSSLPMAFYTALPSGDFNWIWVSEQIERITGFTASKYLEEKHFWTSKIHPEDRDEVLKQCKTIYDKGTIAIEYRWQCSDGLYHWFKDQAVLIRDEQGNPKEIIGTWRDVTERKQAEKSLLDEKNFSDSIINSLPGIFYLFDENGRFLRWNQNLEIVTGYSAEELSEMRPLDFFQGADKELIEEAIRGVFIDGTSTAEANLVSKDRRQTPYFFKGMRFISNDENYLVGVGINITDRKQAEEKICKLNEELEQRVVQRTAQLEAANKEMESFSYSVSHDLRAPVRAIDGFSRILLEDYGDKYDAEGKRLLNIIRSNTKKMGELIDDLLNLSRLGRKEIELSDIDMDKLVKGLFDELGLATNNGKVQFDIKPLPHALGDAGMIHQVFANLLLNAIKFTKPKDEAIIEVGGYTENSKNFYYVKDNGVGFDMKYKDKLFGVFQRLHSGDEFEGTGIGLAIVQRILKRHGGRVWAEGKVNEGATFYFALQLKEGR